MGVITHSNDFCGSRRRFRRDEGLGSNHVLLINSYRSKGVRSARGCEPRRPRPVSQLAPPHPETRVCKEGRTTPCDAAWKDERSSDREKNGWKDVLPAGPCKRSPGRPSPRLLIASPDPCLRWPRGWGCLRGRYIRRSPRVFLGGRTSLFGALPPFSKQERFQYRCRVYRSGYKCSTHRLH